MGDHSHQAVHVDPHAVQHARNLWNNFTKMTTIAVAHIIVLLALMAIFIA